MKAVLFYRFGGPEVLEYTEFPAPEPKPGEALIRLRAASLNRMDVMVRDGWPGLKLELPHINGADGAGEIVALDSPLPAGEGPGVREGAAQSKRNDVETGELDTKGGRAQAVETTTTGSDVASGLGFDKLNPADMSREERRDYSTSELGRLEIGDPVVINANLGCGQCEFCLDGKDNLCRDWHLLGETVRGTYAEFVSVPIKQLYKLPNGFDFHQAAAAALVYQTAWHSLVKRGNIQKGETVLVVGAGGGVNTASVQIAKHLGAQVIVVGSDANKLKMAESIGADILIDRSKEADWSKAVFLATNKRGVDIVVDNVGTTFMMSLRALRKGGRLLTVGNSGAPKFEIDNRFMFAKHLSILGSTMSTLAEFKEVMDLVTTGKLKPVMDRTFALKDAASAQERLWKNENFGKITLDIPSPSGRGSG